MKGNKQATVVLKNSGKVDVYWNYRKIASSGDTEYASINMNFKAIKLERLNENRRRLHTEILLLN